MARPTGTPGQYTIVGVSALEALTANTLNTFPTSVAVRGGDFIGLYHPDDVLCADFTGQGGDVIANQGGAPTVGGLFIDAGDEVGYLLNISVMLSAVGVAALVNHVFLCYSKFEQDGGAVFDVSQQAALIAQGYWLPSAVAGNVAGGDNIGAYHLVCNPPTGLAATSVSLDDGGDVLPDPVVVEGTGYYPILGY